MSADAMIDFMGDSIVLDLKNTIANQPFNGWLHQCKCHQKEAIFVVLFNPTPPSFELALKDSLGKTVLSEVDELILQMYYLYKK